MGQYSVINNYISPDVVSFIKTKIEENPSNQMFFLGTPDASMIVTSALATEEINFDSISSGTIVITNHASGALDITDTEEKILQCLEAKDCGLFIVDNDLAAIKAVRDIVGKNVQKSAKSMFSINDVLGENGLLASCMEDYEVRHGQIEMAQAIEDALNREERLIVEAGTGTGKSMAYLIPALIWARNNESKVVVSTNTINLQEQLMKKDIPMLSKTINSQIKAILVKGRGNYVCLRKLHRAQTEYGDMEERKNSKELTHLISWAKENESGDKSEVDFELSSDLWEEVSSDADMCLHQQCVHYANCKFQMARKDVDRAEILVVNHHLLCADVALRKEKNSTEEKAVLPGYTVAIIDEAHNLSQTATDHFGISISRLKFTRLMNFIYRNERTHSKEYNLGLLAGLRARISTYRWSEESRFEKLKNLLDFDCIPQALRIKDVSDAFFEEVYGYVNKIEHAKTIRLDEEVRSSDKWKDIMESKKRLETDVFKFLKGLESILFLLQNEDAQNDRDDFGVEILELNSVLNRLDVFCEAASFVIDREEKDYVYWIDIGKHKTQVMISATQISIGTPLNEWLIAPLKSFIATSATLTAGNSFSFVKKEIGLDITNDITTREMIVKSPFNYKSQVLLGLINDTPDSTEASYVPKIKRVLEGLIAASGGRAFVLFTSHKLLEELTKELIEPLGAMKIRLLKQNQMPRHALLEEFRRDTKSVLFGTDSFWEGVDVPGEALSCVILVKLPFGVPTDPKIQAKVEHMREEGYDPFNEYYLPSAVLKFKQGFGRLIRSTGDSGTVVVLDSRIVNKNYGRAFIEALPECELTVGKAQDIINAVSSWLG